MVIAAGLLVAVAAPAQAVTSCGSTTKTWYLSDGSISLRLAVIKTHLEVCTDNRSVTTTAASTSLSWTGPGIATGWDGFYHPPYRISFNSNSGGYYRAEGMLHNCESHWSHIFCSRAENYHVDFVVTMQPIVVIRPGPGQMKIGSRVFTFSFTPHNHAGSGIRFNTTI